MNAAAAGSAVHAVEACGVSKVYGRERALAPTTLGLRAGEATALLGPNGAGKSTLLAILAGLLRPTSGEVRFGGRASTVEDRARIGLIAHDALCYPDLTGRENLRFF